MATQTAKHLGYTCQHPLAILLAKCPEMEAQDSSAHPRIRYDPSKQMSELIDAELVNSSTHGTTLYYEQTFGITTGTPNVNRDEDQTDNPCKTDYDVVD
jgi:hypothetical protein